MASWKPGGTVGRWEDLEPDDRLVGALDQADGDAPRHQLISSADTSGKIQWSSRLADECARMVSAAVDAHPFTSGMTVLPKETESGTAEPPTVVYWERGKQKKKKVDVVAGSLILGLQLAISLKGVGFRDWDSLNFDKNVTGRSYELESETRQLHAYRPQALVCALYFLPLASVDDKRSTSSPSSFSKVAEYLRGASGRGDDPNTSGRWHKLDLAFIGLYVPGEEERFTDKRGEEFEWVDPFARGVVRYVDVREPVPYRGRPLVANTLDLEGLVERIAKEYRGESDDDEVPPAPAEPDPPTTL